MKQQIFKPSNFFFYLFLMIMFPTNYIFVIIAIGLGEGNFLYFIFLNNFTVLFALNVMVFIYFYITNLIFSLLFDCTLYEMNNTNYSFKTENFNIFMFPYLKITDDARNVFNVLNYNHCYAKTIRKNKKRIKQDTEYAVWKENQNNQNDQDMRDAIKEMEEIEKE